ncbi:Calcineurin-like phosphoesterase domain, ApaH type,Lariat debranching enzyme, C-terminal,Metallo- [Cinara cedri]|uniref:Calcineurin-like phosphoesterase domain, ApaH type,Lariat debranching enzyme, C-terminal,Metallo n=1 Tax=Cinara cedri TaxID=506608 RepID=A0A5E4M9I4_9HEMI|nr:Calcineurin-like phosphoesterase domain, ApaH type,Lariat debranching enzyme, C-terminal,Metallo- [Cinara cedri]
MKIAVEGCAHGELEQIYNTLELIEKRQNIKVDLLICCGDFQATRNVNDLSSMAVPQKYRQLCTFYKYYTGKLIAPVLTIFIGGNHEASNHLQELSYGGWAAPNIYYMGLASVINVGGIRIGGISGIYKPKDYMRGRHEKPPYNEFTKRSIYHVRQLEVFRLKQLKEPIDIMLSHDWPQGIEKYGNVKQLVKYKPFLKEDIKEGKLGSIPNRELLHELKPKYWFAAHLHCKFAAIVNHTPTETDEKEIKITKFLSLDKCLPQKRFLQILDIPHDDSKPIDLAYDLEWLSVLHLTNHLLNSNTNIYYLPGPSVDERYDFTPTDEEKTTVLKMFSNNLIISNNFIKLGNYKTKTNPQTTKFCNTLRVDDPFALVLGHWPGYSLFFDKQEDEDSVTDSTYSSFLNSTVCSNNDNELNETIETTPKTQFVLPEPKNDTVDINTDGESLLNNFNIATANISTDESKYEDSNIKNNCTSQIFAEENSTNHSPSKKMCLKRRNYLNMNDNDSE